MQFDTKNSSLYLLIATTKDNGYDIHFGARPLRRVIQNNIEDNLSDSLLKGELQPGDTAVIDVEDGKILITPKSSLPIASA